MDYFTCSIPKASDEETAAVAASIVSRYNRLQELLGGHIRLIVSQQGEDVDLDILFSK